MIEEEIYQQGSLQTLLNSQANVDTVRAIIIGVQ